MLQKDVPTPNALPSEAVARFRRDVDALTGTLPPARVGLCISGGPDSLALLLLAHASLPEIEAATVDHGLRPEGAAEADYVASICASLGVPHSTLVLDPDGRKGNVSDWARRERYGALADWAQHRGLDLLLTAHHADDQLETMIMRLNRSSGVAGLAGIRARTPGVARPLLGWRKSELEELVAFAGLSPVDDPSNRDDRFDRARLRKALASADWLDPVAASQSAAALAEAEEALEWTAKAYAGRRIAERDGIVSFSPKGLPRELTRRLVIICLRQIDANANPRGDEVDRLISGLTDGRTATLAGAKCIGGEFWLFSKAPARRTA